MVYGDWKGPRFKNNGDVGFKTEVGMIISLVKVLTNRQKPPTSQNVQCLLFMTQELRQMIRPDHPSHIF